MSPDLQSLLAAMSGTKRATRNSGDEPYWTVPGATRSWRDLTIQEGLVARALRVVRSVHGGATEVELVTSA